MGWGGLAWGDASGTKAFWTMLFRVMLFSRILSMLLEVEPCVFVISHLLKETVL